MNIQRIVFVFVICVTICKKSKVFGYKEVMVNGVRNILALKSERVHVVCNPNNTIPLLSCTFIHPNKTIFRHSGHKIKNGVTCVIEVTAKEVDVGLWQCNSDIKPNNERIQFRIESLFTAVEKKIQVQLGEEVTMRFTVLSPDLLLHFCDFIPPNDSKFSVYPVPRAIPSSSGNSDEEDRYIFPKEADMTQGNCWLKIKKVTPKDVGKWRCVVKVPIGSSGELTDDMELIGFESSISGTQITYIVLGICIAVIGAVLAGLIYWQYKRGGLVLPWRRNTRNEVEMQEGSSLSSTLRSSSNSARPRAPETISTPTTPSLAADASVLADSSSPTYDTDESPPQSATLAWMQRFFPWRIPTIRVQPPSSN